MKGTLPDRLFRWRPPRRIRVTFPGKWFLAITLGVGTAAINTGNNLLYLALSMNLSLVILSGLLSEWTLRKVRVRIGPASELFAGRESFLAVRCEKGTGRFPGISLSVLPVLEGIGGPARFSPIPPGGSATRLVPFLPPRRGAVPPPRFVLSTRFPFGLFEKMADGVPDGPPILVFPEPAGNPGDPRSLPRGTPAEKLTDRTARGDQIRGIREQAYGDSFRDIHWKATARLGRWMVKEREGERGGAAVDLDVPAPSPPEEFERLLSRACAQILRLEREGRPYRLRIGGRVAAAPSDAARRSRALAALAVAAPDGKVAEAGP